MNIFKLVDNQVDTEEALYNLCNYIITPKSNYAYINARGTSIVNAYEEILSMQKKHKKYDGRRAFHFILGFDVDSGIAPCEARDIAFDVSNLFYPTHQVLYAVHSNLGSVHIHFAINSISWLDGIEMILGRRELTHLRRQVYDIIDNYLI